MKASFNVSASITLPGTYSGDSSNHAGQFVVGKPGEELTTAAHVDGMLASMRGEFDEVLKKVKHGLLATIAERDARLEREAEAAVRL